MDIVRRSARAGFPVAVHAIGDLANRRALDAFEETQDEWRPRGLRQRIEHAQLLAPDDMARFADLGVAASVQFSHAPSDRDLADRFWAGKTAGAYAFRSLVDSGALVANGSDAPVEELDPLFGIRGRRPRTLDERRGLAPGAGRDRRAGAAARPASPPPGSPATSAAAGSSSPATSPTSSCSTATRSTARPRSSAEIAGRGDDARRPLGAQPAALGLSSLPGYNAHMRTMRPVHDEECAVACTAEIIGSKWTAIIVHDLSEGPRRFSELERSCPGISPRTLSERLRVLEHDEHHREARGRPPRASTS